jgi:hypothetical protein
MSDTTPLMLTGEWSMHGRPLAKADFGDEMFPSDEVVTVKSSFRLRGATYGYSEEVQIKDLKCAVPHYPFKAVCDDAPTPEPAPAPAPAPASEREPQIISLVKTFIVVGDNGTYAVFRFRPRDSTDNDVMHYFSRTDGEYHRSDPALYPPPDFVVVVNQGRLMEIMIRRDIYGYHQLCSEIEFDRDEPGNRSILLFRLDRSYVATAFKYHDLPLDTPLDDVTDGLAALVVNMQNGLLPRVRVITYPMACAPEYTSPTPIGIEITARTDLVL